MFLKFSYFIALCFVVTFEISHFRVLATSEGCTSRYLLPNRPFVVVWNVPSGQCSNLHLSDWGIVTNEDDKFFGSEMVLFYDIGHFPVYAKNGTEYYPVDGGLPQRADMTKISQSVLNSINQRIPDATYDGLGVIDFESWRPNFNHNYGGMRIYKDKSVELVKARYPSLTNKTLILAEAEREFDIGARSVMEGALQEARTLRPDGKWGYYGIPRCYGEPLSLPICTNSITRDGNDKIGWLFEASTGLYPRIYTNPPSQSLSDRRHYVRQQVNETLRVHAKFSDMDEPILPYTLITNQEYFFDKDDLDIAIKEPAEMGAAGVVIWGSSSFFHIKDACVKLQTYIRTVLGPLVQNVENFTTSCASEHCSDHGRCVRKDYEDALQKHLSKNNKKSCSKPASEYASSHGKASRNGNEENKGFLSYLRNMWRPKDDFVAQMEQNDPYDNFVCHCLEGWQGVDCSRKA